MRIRTTLMIILIITSTLLLGGCWDHKELPAYGFVQSVAIDISEEDENKLTLTTQFIKPAPKIGSAGSSGGEAYVNIETEGDSVFEAVRDITTHLGRKAQWSHTRIILISEEIASKRNIGELLEFFYRDHEPRMLISLGIMEGKAKDYLDQKPFIENTISQQLKEVERAAHKFSSKTMEVNLLTFGRELKSESQSGKIPYYTKIKSDQATVSGLAGFQKGKLAGTITPLETEGLLMLLNEYESGIIEVPCKEPQIIETVEVTRIESNLEHHISNGDVSAKLTVNVSGSIGELKCTSLDKSEKIIKYNKKVANQVQMIIENTLQKLQEDQIDLIGLGNDIYRIDPKKWNEIKDQWPQIFSEVKFDVKVKVNIDNSGSDVGTPFFQK